MITPFTSDQLAARDRAKQLIRWLDMNAQVLREEEYKKNSRCKPLDPVGSLLNLLRNTVNFTYERDFTEDGKRFRLVGVVPRELSLLLRACKALGFDGKLE